MRSTDPKPHTTAAAIRGQLRKSKSLRQHGRVTPRLTCAVATLDRYLTDARNGAHVDPDLVASAYREHNAAIEEARARFYRGGRKPQYDEGPMERHNVTMPASYWRRLDATPYGSRSEAIRQAIDAAYPPDRP